MEFDYPIVEVIRSALPVVDEFVVNVGQEVYKFAEYDIMKQFTGRAIVKRGSRG